jgi:hypothetical protein
MFLFEAAWAQVYSSQGHPFSRSHSRISRRPPLAAEEQVPSSQGHPLSRAYRRHSRWSYYSPTEAQGNQSKGIRCREPVGGTPGARLWPRRSRCSSSKGTRSRGPTGDKLGGRSRPR